ncbi:MAG: ABC transporter ATP-binding protein [Polyangiaceae bacterium]|nr:ABC transporter ATP-binding protein [Polyangiaceae bacterium]
MSYLVLEQLQKTYAGGTHAVKGIDLTISQGELVVLLGPSGCGKTTTLRMVAGLEVASSGSIHLAARDVTHLRPSARNVGMVFQFYALYPHLTVRQNVEFPLHSAGMLKAEIAERLAAVAAQMGIERLLAQYPRQLSGGDQQKVSLARAMVRQPALYLMDEPLGTLDSDQRLSLREIIRARQLELKVTTLYVTHDQEEAMSLADRIVVMEAGLIRQVGTPREIYKNPRDLFVAKFVGSPGMNLIPGTITRDGSSADFTPEQSSARIPIQPQLPAGKAILGVRSEHVHQHPEGPIEGNVVTDEYLGHARNVHVQTRQGRIILRELGAETHEKGRQIRLAFDPDHVVFFDPTSGDRL